ncbi:hypothetical protein JVU11DRAFT_8706 [Chiua virens]|nr:hypothetical protein JVU11DRAFT_8706 [Chiua virens]
MISKCFVTLLALGAIVPFAQATDPDSIVPFKWPTSESTLKRGKTYHAEWRTDNVPAYFWENGTLWLVKGDGTKVGLLSNELVEPALTGTFYLFYGGVDFEIPGDFQDSWPKASAFA